MRHALTILAVLAVVVVSPALAAETTDGANTPPPPRGDLHVRSHVVDVVLNNGFATTEVNQILVNPAAHDVEAEWDFPLPKEGALSELAISIGEDMVIGEVVEKQKAEQIYQEEKKAGRDTAVMEQRQFYDYHIKLARVPAGGEVRVRVVYYQPLDIDSGVGRYVYPLSEGGTDDMKRSFWTMSKDVDGEMRFDVTLKTAFPVDGLHCPSHPGLQSVQKDEQTWQATWAAPSASLDRDFVLYYRLAPDVPARIELLTHRREGDGEGTWMAVVTPGADLAPIEKGTDWAFVLDVSGSMKGEKIRMLRQGVAKALQGLGGGDRVHLIAFNDQPHALIPDWIEVKPDAMKTLGHAIDKLSAGGSTNIHAALQMAYRSLDADRPSGIILVSDGVANTGPHSYRDFIQLAKAHDVRLFTFVMGNSANERLLGDLATLSNGFAKSVSVHDEVGAHLLLAKDRMSHQAMHGVTFQMDGVTVRHPQTLPSLYLGQQLVLFGRYAKIGPATMRVTAKISGQPAQWEIPVDLPGVDLSNPELERLYALFAISDLEREAFLRTGDETEAKDAITDMAIRYSLVTDYTSMIVVQPDRKDAYGLGDANAAERAAAAARQQGGNTLQVQTGTNPLAGQRAAHAPTRAQRRVGTGGSGGGGGGGSGAVGPFFLIPAAGLALLALRRRKRKVQ